MFSDDDDDVPRPTKRPRPSLFLPDSDNDDHVETVNKPDIANIFDDAENDESLAYVPLPAPLDLDALRREADARHAQAIQPLAPSSRPILPSSSPPRDTQANAAAKGKQAAGKTDEAGGKTKRKIFKLDESTLLGPTGFPQLINESKGFKPKGKGHEASDLTRLLQIYQFWTHRLYPKTRFKDTVESIEKLCHSRRMHVALSVWRDEAHGRVNGHAMEISSDNEAEQEDEDEPANAQGSTDVNPTATSSTSQPPSRVPSPATSPSRPPSSASEYISPDDDFDIDALIRAEGDRATSQPPPLPSTSTPDTTTTTHGKPRSASLELMDRDEAMWDEMMQDDAPPRPAVPRVVPPQNLFDDDEDMWDAVQEMDKDPPPPPLPVTPDPQAVVQPPKLPMDDEEEFDTMFL